MEYNIPCKLCREQALSVGNGYCKECLTAAILGYYSKKYPVSVNDLKDKLDKHL